MNPVFFNPRAKLSRDLSLIVYQAFSKNFKNEKIFLDGLSGVGIRGLRVANELNMYSIINDLNPTAIQLARDSAKINNASNVKFSKEDVCRFLSTHSTKYERGSIVDVDPFGSPVSFFDCGLRATIHGGIFSCTATDLQVLNGLFNDACDRKYGGIPIRVKYGNEIALRLILGCLSRVAGRLDISITPIFVESNRHYYRTYTKVEKKIDQRKNIGFITHCTNCKYRETTSNQEASCKLCGSKNEHAGPLWIGRLFDKKFVQNMTIEELTVDKNCEKILAKALLESDMPGTYYTLDEVASIIKSSPPKLDDIIASLKSVGFLASPTLFNPTGFRTDATINDISKIFLDV